MQSEELKLDGPDGSSWAVRKTALKVIVLIDRKNSNGRKTKDRLNAQ